MPNRKLGSLSRESLLNRRELLAAAIKKLHSEIKSLKDQQRRIDKHLGVFDDG